MKAEVAAAWLPRLLAPVRVNDPAVAKLDLTHVGLADAEGITVAEALAGNLHVRWLSLDYNSELTDATGRALVGMQPRCPVTLVNLDGCDGMSAAVKAEVAAVWLPRLLAEREKRRLATAAELEALLAAVRVNHPAVTELRLFNKDLTDAQGIAVAEALDGNTHVLTLRLSFNSELTDATGRALIGVLPWCVVTSVDLNWGAMSAAARAEVVAVWLPRLLAPVRANDPAVTQLDLSHVGLTDAEGIAVAEGLDGNTRVLKLDLGHNSELTDATGRALVGMQPRCAVTSVGLSSCDGVSAAVKASLGLLLAPRCLAAVAADSATLQSLAVSSVWHIGGFGDAEAVALAAALATNTQLGAIYLHQGADALGDAGASSLEQAVKRSGSGVACVNFSKDSSTVSQPRRAAIAHACLANGWRRAAADDPKFESLTLRSDSGLGDGDASHLAASLRGNTALRFIDLYGNKAAAGAIAAALVDALPQCGVESVHMNSSGISPAAEQGVINLLCKKNVHTNRVQKQNQQQQKGCEPEPEPEFAGPAAEEGEPPALAALRAELSSLKVRALTKRAEAVGVDQGSLDAAGDAGDLIELIVAKTAERLTREAAQMDLMRSELSGLKIRALTKRTEEVGVDEGLLDDVEGAEDLIGLIMAMVSQAGAAADSTGAALAEAVTPVARAAAAAPQAAPEPQQESHGKAVIPTLAVAEEFHITSPTRQRGIPSALRCVKP